MMLTKVKEYDDNVVQLEINLAKLEALFSKGELCAADVRCLNCVSKACIRKMCLHLSAECVSALPYCGSMTPMSCVQLKFKQSG